jgi:hypothetical protein
MKRRIGEREKFKVGDKVSYISRGSGTWSGCVISSCGVGTISRIELDKMFPVQYFVRAGEGRTICCQENQIVKMV